MYIKQYDWVKVNIKTVIIAGDHYPGTIQHNARACWIDSPLSDEKVRSGAATRRGWKGSDPCPYCEKSYTCPTSDSFLPSLSNPPVASSLEMINIASMLPWFGGNSTDQSTSLLLLSGLIKCMSTSDKGSLLLSSWQATFVSTSAVALPSFSPILSLSIP